MTKTFLRTLSVTLLVGLAAPALAQTGSVNTGVNANVTGTGVRANAEASVTAKTSSLITTAKARAAQELDRRVASLNTLLTRVNAMAKVDATFKASLSSTVQAQITELTNLKATIDADTEVSTLKTGIQSITKSYRVYALVLPQATIGAAADRVQTLVTMFTTLGTKLQARISASTGDTSAAVTAMADFNAKVADAQVQATAAINHIAGLQPDNGDKTIMASNTAALKQARADIRVAQQDFAAARKDVDVIIKALGSVNVSADANTTVQTQ